MNSNRDRFLQNMKGRGAKWSIELGITLLIGILSVFIFREYLFNGEIFAAQTGIKSDLIRINLPTYIHLYDALTQGFHLWSWEMGLGTEMMTHADCYFDPFTYIMFIGGRDNIANLMVWSLIAKILCEGLAFSFFIRKYCKHNSSVIISSVVYAFCGYSLIMGYNFAIGTVLVYFPLVLKGVDDYLEKSSKKLLVFSLCLVGMLSFYLLFVTGALTFVYLVIRCIQQKKNIAKAVLQLFFAGLISICVCAFTLFPQIYLLLNNARTNSAKDVVWSMELIIPSLRTLATMLIRSMGLNLLGDNITTNFIMLPDSDYYQIEGFVTCLFPVLFAHLWKLRKDKHKEITQWFGCILIFTLFPVFSYIFNACSTINYRWMFCIHIALCCMIAMAIDAIIDNGKIDIRTTWISSIFSALCCFLVMAYLFKERGYDKQTAVNHLMSNGKYFFIVVIIYILFIVITYMTNYVKNKKVRPYLIYSVLFLVMFVELGGNYSEWYGKNLKNEFEVGSQYGYDDSSAAIIEKIAKSDNSPFYRIYKDFDSVYDFFQIPSDNDAMAQSYYGLKSYSSQNNPEYINFLQKLGVYVACVPDVGQLRAANVKPEDFNGPQLNYINGIDDKYQLLDYLGVKYYLKRSSDTFSIDLSKLKYLYSENGIDVYENTMAYELGFVNNKYMRYDDFIKLSYDDRLSKLLDTTILDNEEYDNFAENSSSLNANSCNVISFSSDNIKMKANIEDQQAMLSFSIPYDEGWMVFVDGEKVDTSKVNISLLGVKLTKGEHIVEIKYVSKSFVVGCGITALSVIAIALIYLYQRKNKVRNSNC